MHKAPYVTSLALALGALGCAGNGAPPATIQQTVTVPARVQSTLSAASCSPGAQVNVTGELVLGGLGAEIILRNNAKGTHEHTDEAAASAILIPAQQTLSIPTQTANGEPVANPVLSVQLLDAAGNPVSAEIVLGPCAAGPFTVTADAAITTQVSLLVTVNGCANHPGPTITLEGAITFSGLQERLIVRAGNGGAVVGTTTTKIDVVALDDGKTISVPKQPVRGGVGGNPWISVRLVDGTGAPLSDEIAIGRCVQLAGEHDEDEHD